MACRNFRCSMWTLSFSMWGQVSWVGIEPMLLALEGWILRNWTPRGIFICRLFNDGHSDRCELVPHCSFDFHFSNKLGSWTLPLALLMCIWLNKVDRGIAEDRAAFPNSQFYLDLDHSHLWRLIIAPGKVFGFTMTLKWTLTSKRNLWWHKRQVRYIVKRSAPTYGNGLLHSGTYLWKI